MLPPLIRPARLAALMAAGLVFAGTALPTPAVAQQDSKVQIQRPPAADTPGSSTYRLNPLEKQRLEEANQKKLEEEAARTMAPDKPANDPATQLREGWYEPPGNGPSNQVVKDMIRNGTVRK